MPAVPPPADFARTKLEIETIAPELIFKRIYWSTYPDPAISVCIESIDPPIDHYDKCASGAYVPKASGY